MRLGKKIAADGAADRADICENSEFAEFVLGSWRTRENFPVSLRLPGKNMVNDAIGDMLIQIKNALNAGKSEVILPASKLKLAVAKILVEEKYLSTVEVIGSGVHRDLKLTLKYDGKVPAIIDVKRKSKPGLRLYVGSKEIPKVIGGLGMTIISTPKGVMTGKQAYKMGIGGELLCEVW